MATTSDMAPGRPAVTTRRAATGARVREDLETVGAEGSGDTEADLRKEVDQLRNDIKNLAATLSKLGNEKVSEAQGRAKQEYRNLVQAGQSMVEDVSDEFTHVERQLKDTIRERPITAVLSAMGIGYLIALLTR